MNNIHSRLRQLKQTAIVILILLAGCTDRIDLPDVDGQEGVPEGMVRITINPSIEQHATVVTRSTQTPPSAADKVIGADTYVLVATTNTPAGVLLQEPAQATYTATDKLKATLYEQSSDCYLWVVANVSAAEKSYLSALGAGTTISTITDALKHRLFASSYTTAPSLPMYGVSDATKLEKGGTSPTHLSVIPIPLSRSVARIDVDGSASTANFTVHSMQIANGAPYGFTLPQTTLPTFGETEVSEYKEIAQTPATTMTDLVFCYENSGNTDGAADRATRVVICGTPTINGTPSASPSYYPIDIIYPADPAKPKENLRADIERNKLYKITLTRVDKDGYRTYAEAARSEAFNKHLDMDITVSDPYAHDITTNGKQYLGITNSEFVLYPRTRLEGSPAVPTDIDVNNVHIATYTYTSDPGWAAGSITFTGDAGLSIASGSTTRMDASPFPITRDLLVDISKDFRNGTVVLHIGNLRKEIKVRRMTATSPTGGIYQDYFVSSSNNFDDYKVGEIITPSAATSWIKVSADPASGAGESSLNDKVTNPEGGIYIHTEANVGYNGNAIDREAMLYVAGEKDDQRIKIMVQQTTFDVYKQAVQLEPYAYVGTFHRWNETGERLIRIRTDFKSTTSGYDPSKVYWQADVVAGREFIVLDLLETQDAGIKIFNGPGKTNVNWNGQTDNPNVTTSAAIETSPGGQLNSKLRTVRGTGNSIYFRVGLTGKLSGPEAQPRYGLITISYGYDGGAPSQHNIYVRQGEAADYLMRPWDPSTIHPNGWYDYTFSSRPKARKFAPYHLTDPAPGANVVDRGKRGYTFVDYPSQGGYFFPASGTKAVNPTVTGSQSLTTPPVFDISNPWNTDWETCPRGYRRPADGTNRLYADKTTLTTDPKSGGAPLYPTDIIDSEVRQSLWLYPLHGGYKSDFTNQIRGFLADGYFDRRQVTQTTQSFDGGQKYAIVASGAVSAAYWGFLVFNPHNYASIFFPLNGYYNEGFNPYGVKNQGRTGDINTATAGSGNNDGWVVGMGYFNDYGTGGVRYPAGWAFDMYSKTAASDGYSIRCIKDEQEIISSQPGGGGGTVTIDPIVPANPDTDSQLAIRHLYKTTDSRSLQEQIEVEYDATTRPRINSIAISGDKTLTAEDYVYLNAWAAGTQYSGSILHHLIIRGKGNLVIPNGAITSANWSNIMLLDATTIKTGAFASGIVSGTLPYSVVGMRNLTLKHLDAITIEAGAFPFPTGLVQLHLDKTGDEYKNNTSGSPKTVWTNNGVAYTWQAIKGE